MPRRAGSNETQITIRIPVSALDRAAALVEKKALGAPPGVTPSRADALRAALLLGLDELEHDAMCRTSAERIAKRLAKIDKSD